MGKKKNYLAHRLVALHFISNKNNYSIVNHIDGNKLNNVVENLEWTNYSKNRQHSYDNNLCCKRGKQKNIKTIYQMKYGNNIQIQAIIFLI